MTLTVESPANQCVSRLVDSYTEGYLEKQEFELRITCQRQRIAALEEHVRHLADADALQRELHLLIGRLEDFAAQVEHGLEAADRLTRREIIRQARRSGGNQPDRR